MYKLCQCFMLSAFAFSCAVHSVSLQASALSFATHNYLKLLTAHENRQIIYWEVMVPFKECKGQTWVCLDPTNFPSY